MENIKKKGFLGRLKEGFKGFLKWLRTPEEEEIVNGGLNPEAFSSEDIETIAKLNGQIESTEKMRREMFNREIREIKERAKKTGANTGKGKPVASKTKIKDEEENERDF